MNLFISMMRQAGAMLDISFRTREWSSWCSHLYLPSTFPTLSLISR